MGSEKRQAVNWGYDQKMNYDRAECLACGKQGFRTRKAVRRYLKQRGWRINAYRCPYNETPYCWHAGHLPTFVKDGSYGRDVLG